MKTRIIKIDTTAPDWDKQLDDTAEILRSGGLVAFPTETVYGLGANALDAEAVEAIYRAKGRPSDNPLIVHIADTATVKDLADSVPETAQILMDAFWPGPLTLVLPRSSKVSDIITAGLDTVAVRMPSHPIASALIKKAGVPVAAPSANSSGRPSPTLARHVIEDLMGKVDVIIDGGNAEVGVESTVLDITVTPPVILRPGGVTLEQLRCVLGDVVGDQAPGTADITDMTYMTYTADMTDMPGTPKSPGMKYRHYSPRATLLLLQGEPERVAAEISKRAELYHEEGTAVGILVTDETAALYEPSLYSCCKILSLGSRKDPGTLASNLFRCLREFDEKGVEVIMAETTDVRGIDRQ